MSCATADPRTGEWAHKNVADGGAAMNRMSRSIGGAAVSVMLSLTWVARGSAGTLRCPPDSVKVGDACVDRYEESVWQIPPSNTALVKMVVSGRATLADLTS